MKPGFCLLLSALSLLLTVCTARESQAQVDLAEAKNVELRWKFSPGTKLDVSMQQKMRMLINQGGQKMETINDTTTHMTWRIDTINEDGSAQIATIIDRVKLDMQTPNGERVQYDSATPQASGKASEPIAEVYQTMLGQDIMTKMMPSGEITDVQIPRDAVIGLNNSRSGMSADALQRLTKEASPSFPDSISSGDEWTKSSEMDSPIGKMVLVSKFKYHGVQKIDDKPLHRIEMTIDISFSDSSALAGVKLEIVSQDNKGVILFDNEMGRIFSSSMRQDMTVNINSRDQIASMSLVQDVENRFSEKQPEKVDGEKRDQ